MTPALSFECALSEPVPRRSQRPEYRDVGEILAGMASSHAFAFVDPAYWDRRREANRQRFQQRYGSLPPVDPKMERETDESVRERYAGFERALRRLGETVRSFDPTALVIVGDDQDENFVDECLPQVAIFVTDEIEAQIHPGPRAEAHPKRLVRYRRTLAEAILEYGVDQGFEIAVSYRSRHPAGLGHAFGPPLRFLDPDLRVPVVCLALNAIHVPAPSPQRCLALGRMLRRAIARTDERVIVYGSGGLSHFTAGFPYGALGRFCYGEIHAEFDGRLLAALGSGDDAFLASLSSTDLLEHGDVEFRSWLVTHGAMDGASAEVLAYEPFYRANMGMGCALWS